MERVFGKESINESFFRIEKLAKEFVESKLNFQDFLLQKVKEEDKAIYELLLSFLLKGEAISPGTGEIFLELLAKKQPIAVGSPKSFQRKDLESLLRSFCENDQVILSIVKSSFDLAGFGGKVSLSVASQDSVEMINGFSFESISPAFKLSKSYVSSPRVVCIDGFVENVSEIHRLLEACSEKKEPLLMFFRGASEDVIHTLKINFERNTLEIIPVVVPYDLDGVNLLNDISAICGGDVVSSLKGDLIGSIDLLTLPRIDKAFFDANSICLENRNARINHHIHFLQEKLLNSSQDSEKSILEKRIKRLGNNQVIIRLAEDKKVKRRKFFIDRSIRAVRAATDFGVVRYGEKILPNSTVVAARMLFSNFLKTIEEIGALVY